MKKLFEKIRGSLTARIFLITALILLVACAATYLFMALATPITFRTVASDEIHTQINKLVSELGEVTMENSAPVLNGFMVKTGITVAITDEDGKAVSIPDANLPVFTYTATISKAEIQPKADGESDSVISTYSVSSDDPYALQELILANTAWDQGFRFLGDDTDYQLCVVYSATEVNQTVEAMRRVLPYLALMVLGISFLGAVLYSRYITKPIVRLSGISQRMAKLDFSWRCEEKRPDEIGMLGRNLDQMAGSLSTALAQLKDANDALQDDILRQCEQEKQRSAFFAAASHELKTPVTVLKGQLSGMLGNVDVYKDRDTYLAKSLAVTGRMEKLIREMLEISRLEKDPAPLKKKPVALNKLAQTQLEQARELAALREQSVQAQIAPDVTVHGDEALLGCVIANLLTNALNHSPDGAAITLTLAKEGDAVRLCVRNTAPPIPEEALPHLFEAFYRVDASRSRETGGSGLGLYFVKMILDRHGAQCAIRNGDGCVEAVVTFPAE